MVYGGIYGNHTDLRNTGLCIEKRPTFADENQREQAAPQQFERARLHSVCTVLAAEIKSKTESYET